MTQIRIGSGIDVHAFGEGIPMFLCGVQVESPIGFIAHSDGDVAIHALCDALLGALALGDIGHLFPDTDPAFKGIDSRKLLAEVMRRVRAEGYELVNADLTICLQTPKVAPYILRFRQSLAEVCGVDVNQISVKATTTEHLGFVGRKEGCLVHATVLVEKA